MVKETNIELNIIHKDLDLALDFWYYTNFQDSSMLEKIYEVESKITVNQEVLDYWNYCGCDDCTG